MDSEYAHAKHYLHDNGDDLHVEHNSLRATWGVHASPFVAIGVLRARAVDVMERPESELRSREDVFARVLANPAHG